ncbi:MAG: MBL fold metallo-hydrolase, partial [candidate division WOR-3 bacterium]|nr:MBL fold metallo-hydrolase [candidate division WOR-3 bacterium]
VTGCAHPGIVNIVRKAKELLNKNIYLVLGGFHLMAYSEKEVKEIIKELEELGVEKIAPSHCTGGRPIELFREAWGENFLDLGCGAVFKVRASQKPF